MKKIKLSDNAYRQVCHEVERIPNYSDNERRAVSKRFQEVFSNLKVYPDQKVVEVCDSDFEYLKNFLDWSEYLANILRNSPKIADDTNDYSPIGYEIIS